MTHKEPRWDLIRHLRQQIAAGTYETRGKLEIAAKRLITELATPSRGDHRGKVEGKYSKGL